MLGTFIHKMIIPLANDYSQLGTSRLVGYLSSHIQRKLVE